MNTLWCDLRLGIRMMFRSPVFTLVAAVTLALGIGANTAIFSLLSSLFFQPLPVRDPAGLVTLYTSDFSGPRFGTSSYPDYEYIRAHTAGVLEGVLAYTVAPVNVRAGDQSERVFAELTSEDYFAVLGTGASVGRVYSAEESRSPVVLLSHRYWTRRFQADPNVVGKTLAVNGTLCTVAGVVPREFLGGTRLIDIDVWVPLPIVKPKLDGRGSRDLFLMARLKPGATVEQAQAALDVLAAQLHTAYPDTWSDINKQGRRLTAMAEAESRLPPQAQTPVLGFFALLLCAVGLVILIACANIASLLLARATARRREIAVRLAIGASRGRLVRQLLTENLMLALLGGCGGVLLAKWLNLLIAGFKPPLPVSIVLSPTLNAGVLAFAASLTLLTAILFGLTPALQSTRTDLLPALKDGLAATAGRTRLFSLRNGLVVAQVAAAVVLLAGAGLFLRSLQNAYNLDAGYRTGNMLLASVDLEPLGYTAANGQLFQKRWLERVRNLPGVQAAEFAGVPSLGLEAMQRRGFELAGYTPRPGDDMEHYFNVAGPAYFETLAIPIVRGRAFTDEDRQGAPAVAIVNQTFARRFWPDQDPIGKTLDDGTGKHTIVGVAKDAKYVSLGEEPRPYVYLALLQHYQHQATLHVRTTIDPHTLIPAIRREAESVDRQVPLSGVHTFEDQLDVSLLPSRIAASMLTALGVLALLLAATGLYGVIAFAVSRRTREIGIRMSLGAEPESILRMVARETLLLAGAGVGIGVAVSAAATRLLRGLLLGVSPVDPTTFAAVMLLMVVVALLAGLGPARLAAGLDPMAALRME